MRYQDLSGLVFGKLTVLKRACTNHNRAWFTCKCECGSVVDIDSQSLKRGLTKSCGCYRKEFRQNGYDPVINDLYSVYKRDATKKQRDFSLTKEEFSVLVTNNCVYCGSPPDRTHRYKRIKSNLKVNGIDRKDNSLGYTIENTQTCCSFCNQAKHTNTEEVFLNWIDKLIKHRSKS